MNKKVLEIEIKYEFNKLHFVVKHFHDFLYFSCLEKRINTTIHKYIQIVHFFHDFRNFDHKIITIFLGFGLSKGHFFCNWPIF